MLGHSDGLQGASQAGRLTPLSPATRLIDSAIVVLITDRIDSARQIRLLATVGVDPVARRAQNSKCPPAGFGGLRIARQRIGALSAARRGDAEYDRQSEHWIDISLSGPAWQRSARSRGHSGIEPPPAFSGCDLPGSSC